MKPDAFLEGLTGPQREAVTHAEGPLLVIAGPGSGKTRVITHRAAYLAHTVTQPRHILAITFTNKAANEMAERIERLRVPPGITCMTFHSFCARLLRIYADRASIHPNYTIFDTADQVAAMKDAIPLAGLSGDNYSPTAMLNAISQAKNDMVAPDDYSEYRPGWQSRMIADVYRAYEQVLASQNALDFDDLLVRVARLLGDDPELRAGLQERYRYVLVDEYQDTNHAQYLIARGLALDHENLCVTGDPDQSIYAWRGANLHNILDFEKDFPKSKVVRLEQNYRSTPQILRAADAVIQHNAQRKLKALWTENVEGPAVRVVECGDAAQEAAFIAEAVALHAEHGGRYGGVAVFYRINALSRLIEAALRHRHIPYQIARGVAFYARKEIKDILAYLHVVANPSNEVALLRIINTPARGIGKVTVDRLLAHARSAGVPPIELLQKPERIEGIQGRSAASLRSFAELMIELSAIAAKGRLEATLKWLELHSGLRAMWHQDQNEEAQRNVDELINAAAQYDHEHADRSGSLQDWLAQISLVGDTDAIDPETGTVTLMTLHAAKGLEFDTVFIAGVEDRLLPHQRSEHDRASIEEERRLCFVGMTRAMRALILTSARYRDVRGTTVRTSQSPFLFELPAGEIEWVQIGDEVGGGQRDEDEMAASSLDFLNWRRGQLVRHEEYGLGRVVWIRPSQGKTHAGVTFAAYGDKTLVLEYANLEVVEADEIGD